MAVISPKTTIVGTPSGVPYVPDLPQEVSIEHTAEGLWSWTNSLNGFHVTLVHFTSDAEKNNAEFVEEALRGSTGKSNYEREYNIRWQSFKGQPVYADEFKREFHVSTNAIPFQPHLPIVRGWDFGLYPACVFTQLWPGLKLVVLHEICESGMGLERFLEEVKRKTLEWYPTHKRFLEVVDPAGYSRVGTDEQTYVAMMADRDTYHLEVMPGVQVPARRIGSIRGFLSRNLKGDPALWLDPSCKMVIGGFDGGYHFAFNLSGQLRESPEKNIYSHPHDALQYVGTRILDMDLTGSDNIKIVQPTYGFKGASAMKDILAHV